MEEVAEEEGLGLLQSLLQEIGFTNLLLFLLLAFTCFLIWHLIWKVWSAALKSKDDEIERLVKERDKYQQMCFQKFLSSAPPAAPESKPKPNQIEHKGKK